MCPTPSSPQRDPQPSSRRRRVAKPAAMKAAPKAAAAMATPAMTSGVAYFTFSDTGELTITSYELAAALRKLGGKKLLNAKRVKVGVYAGTGVPKQRAAAGKGAEPGYSIEDNPQLDSMCMCDVKC